MALGVEELRVLPALTCGVIVIAEESPLKEHIPYNDLIIWTPYDNIIEKIKDVIEHYEEYHSKIFNNNTQLLFDHLHNMNIKHLKDKLTL